MRAIAMTSLVSQVRLRSPAAGPPHQQKHVDGFRELLLTTRTHPRRLNPHAISDHGAHVADDLVGEDVHTCNK